MHTPSSVPAEQLLTAVLGASNDLVVMVDVNGTIHDVAETGRPVLGRARDDWIGASLLNHVHPDDRTSVVDRLADIWAGAEDPTPNIPFRAAHAEGFWLSLEITGGRSVESAAGNGIVIVIRDVTQRADAERRLRETCRELDFVVSHDPLTGLPNRSILHARLDALTRRLRPTDCPAHVIMIKVLDLDELRQVHGVTATTSIMHEFADAVRSRLDDAEFIGVDGIGEIVALTRPDRNAFEIDQLAEEFLRLADAPVSDSLRTADVRLSVGVSVLHPGISADEALEHVARAAALGRRRNSLRPIHFEHLHASETDPRRRAQDELRSALAEGQLELWYQPIINTRSDRLYGFEGLLRWMDPGHGVRTASEFLPPVEGSAAMLDLGEFVWAEGSRRLAAWQQHHGAEAPSLALNVSGRQLGQPDFADRVLHHLDASGADPTGLCLELTETHAIGGDSDASAQLAILRDHGVRLGLDDFGTGYSSLHHLHNIRADVLKIDQTFVSRLGNDPGATAIVRASVEMGAAFGMFTVAEGVTSPAQRQLLRVMGCDGIQGYLTGPALPAATADALLRDVRSPSGRAGPQILIEIERQRRALEQLDDGYRPSDDEIAAAAGVMAHDVRVGSTPPRFEALDDRSGSDREPLDDAGRPDRSAELDDAGARGDDDRLEL